RLGQDLAVAIASDVLAQEVEAVLPMRDPGLLVRELQPSFLQEVGHERSDLITKEVLRCAGDPQVIRIADPVDLVHPLLFPRSGDRAKWSARSRCSPSRVQFASAGERIPP